MLHYVKRELQPLENIEAPNSLLATDDPLLGLNDHIPQAIPNETRPTPNTPSATSNDLALSLPTLPAEPTPSYETAKAEERNTIFVYDKTNAGEIDLSLAPPSGIYNPPQVVTAPPAGSGSSGSGSSFHYTPESSSSATGFMWAAMVSPEESPPPPTGSGTGTVSGGGSGSGSGSSSGSGTGSGSSGLGVISGRAWSDDNTSNTRDSGEFGVPSLQVDLLQDGVSVAVAQTDIDGSYSFANLTDGSYQVKFTVASYQQFATPHVGDATLDSDVFDAAGTTATLFVSEQTPQTNIDAGIHWLPTIGVYGRDSVTEGAGPALFELSRTDTSSTLTANYTIRQQLAGETTPSIVATGTVTLAIGESLQEVAFETTDDTEYFGDRTLSLTIDSVSIPGLSVAPTTTTVQVNDDETVAMVWIDGASQIQEGDSGTIRLVRNFGEGGLSVEYQLTNEPDSATPDIDYVAIPLTAVFADGKYEIAIPIDTLTDSLEEPDEFVGITLVSATRQGVVPTPWTEMTPAPDTPILMPPPPYRPTTILGQPGPVPKAKVVDQVVQDGQPVFDAQNPNPFIIGIQAPAKTFLGTVKAVDPEGKPVRYRIDPAATAGIKKHFTIDAETGRLSVSANLPEGADRLPNSPPGNFTIPVLATDGTTAPVKLDVQVAIKPMVVLVGDTHAVEGNIDAAVLQVKRFTATNDQPLDVSLKVTWGGVSQAREADIGQVYAAPQAGAYNLSQLMAGLGAGQHTITVRIPANSNVAHIGAKALVSTPTSVDNAGIEGVESIPIKVVTTDNYTSLGETVEGYAASIKDAITNLHPAENMAFLYRGASSLQINILDEVKLFTPNNAKPELVDASPLGADYNDVRQGMVGDCWLMAAVAAFANRSPQAVVDRVKLEGNNVKVHFYKENGRPDGWTTVPLSLVSGDAQASLDSDTDQTTGAAEVWVQMVEKAWQKKYGAESIDGGFAATALRRLTGHQIVEKRVNQLTENDLQKILAGAKPGGRMMTLSRPAGPRLEIPGPTPDTISILPGSHAYAVIGTNVAGDALKIYNPWGEVVIVPLNKVKEYFAGGNYEGETL